MVGLLLCYLGVPIIEYFVGWFSTKSVEPFLTITTAAIPMTAWFDRNQKLRNLFAGDSVIESTVLPIMAWLAAGILLMLVSFVSVQLLYLAQILAR